MKQSPWLTAIREVDDESLPVVPSGFKTLQEIADELGMTKPHTGKLVRKLKNVEMRTFHIKLKNWLRKYPVRHYRLNIKNIKHAN